jgi:hypothetical protein
VPGNVRLPNRNLMNLLERGEQRRVRRALDTRALAIA